MERRRLVPLVYGAAALLALVTLRCTLAAYITVRKSRCHPARGSDAQQCGRESRPRGEGKAVTKSWPVGEMPNTQSKVAVSLEADGHRQARCAERCMLRFGPAEKGCVPGSSAAYLIQKAYT